MKSKLLTFSLGCLAAFMLLAIPVSAQHTKRMTFEAGEVTMLPGINALITADENGLKIEMVPPKGQRDKKYKDVDLASQDRIIMCNGKKVKTIAELTAIIEGVEIGDEISFGIKRGKDMMIASFPKGDPKESGNMMMMTTTIDDDGSSSSETTIMKDGVALTDVVMLKAGLILKDEDNKPIIIAILPEFLENIEGEAPKEGDVIVSLNSEKNLTSKQLDKKYNEIKMGEMVSVSFMRGSETFTIKFKKQPQSEGEVIIKK